MQMDLHTCAKFVHNLCSCLASYQYFWIYDPKTLFKCPLGLEGLICLAYFHSRMNLYTCAKFVPDRSRGLEAFPHFWIDDPLTPMPLGYHRVTFSSCPSPDEYAHVSQICFRSVQPFGFFPTCWHLWPPDPLQMPLGTRGVICLAYVHSLMNRYTFAKFDPDRSSGLEAFPDLWIGDPLTPHAPRVSRG